MEQFTINESFINNEKQLIEEKPVKQLSNIKAFFTLFKGFIAVGILFLPNGFSNGGWLFSTILMVFSYLLSYYCIHLMITTKLQHGGNFMELGQKAWG